MVVLPLPASGVVAAAAVARSRRLWRRAQNVTSLFATRSRGATTLHF
jgi:hypothetical protein